MKIRICFTAAVLFICTNLFAQALVYPTVGDLQNSLRQLLQSSANRYANIDGGAADAASPDYRVANFHIVANARNQLFISSPTIDSYLEFLSEGINEQQATVGFEKWKTLFEKAMPEFIFLSHRNDTYGQALYYYNKEQTHMFVLEVYFSPVKKTWTISLNLYHPTKSDKGFIAKKNNPDADAADAIAQQKAINQTLTALLKGRAGGFQSFRGLDMSGKDGTKMFGVKETDYAITPGPVEYIDVDAAGAVIYHLAASGFQIPIQITLCYAGLITPAFQQQGYSIAKEETTYKLSYTILFNHSYGFYLYSAINLSLSWGLGEIVNDFFSMLNNSAHA